MPAAFPGAHGWGAGSVGGRGGTIIEVTNLNDTGGGSLRNALQDASGARIVIPRVSGVVNIADAEPILVSNPYITFAGQAAPGSGLWFRGSGIQIRTHNWIFRYLTYRGTGNTNDRAMFTLRSVNAEGCHDGILDHCSGAWNMDDLIDIYHNSAGSGAIKNITVQNCLLSEGDDGHPTGVEVGNNTGMANVNHISILRNLFSTMGWRNPMCEAHYEQVINNVVYNWSDRVMDTQNEWGAAAGPEVDVINNAWLDGAQSAARGLLHWPAADSDPASIYIAGQYAPGMSITDPTADNWPLCKQNTSGYPALENSHKRSPWAALAQSSYPISIVAASGMLTRLSPHVGNAHRLNSEGNWVSRRDSHDQTMVDDAINDTGPATQPNAPGTLPTHTAGTAYTDTDGDGMADDWEDLHGLDKNSSTDQNSYTAGNGYTNIENFLNGIPILALGGPPSL